MKTTFGTFLPMGANFSRGQTTPLPHRGGVHKAKNPQASQGDVLTLSRANSAQVVRFGAGAPTVDDVALWQAAGKGETESVAEILEKAEINPNRQHIWGSTPLAAATVNGHTDIVRKLLEKNADPNLANDAGVTPSMQAARYGREEILGLLLKHGANPHVKDNEGNTALMYATAGNHRPAVRLLLKAKADPAPKNGMGISALMLARDNDHRDIYKDLRKAEKSSKRKAIWQLPVACWTPGPTREG